MKRSLFLAFICLAALGTSAQNIPQFVGEYLPYHQFLTTNTPTINGVGGNSSNQLKDFTAHFPYAELHYVYGSNGWNIQDSSTFTYIDSLDFPAADTTLAYISSNQSWVLDSEFSVSAYYLPSQPVTDQDSFQATKTGQVYNTGTSSWSSAYQYNYGYDDIQRLISTSYQVWSSNNWVTVASISTTYNDEGLDSTRSVSTYNSGGTLISDTEYVYTYNAQNQVSVVLVRVGGVPFQQYNYQYTPISGLFTGIKINTYSNGSWLPYGTYSYSRNNNQASYLLQVYNSSSQLVNTYEEIFSLDYRNNILSFENDSFSGNTPVPLIQYIYSYDVDNDVTFEQDGYWNGSSYSPTDQYYYYYEWRSVTAIKDVDNNNTLSASIFPNPSDGELNIRLTAETNSSLVISVYDVSGRKVSMMNTNVIAGNNTLSMQLTQLAAGNYLINIKDPNNGELTNLNWIKQ